MMNALRTLALPALAATALLVGCSSEAAALDPAVGTWNLDGAATFEASKASLFAEMSAEEQALASEMMAPMVGSMSATMMIAEDGTFTGDLDSPMGDATQKMSGTWAHENSVLTMVTTEEGIDEARTITATIEGDRFKALVPADSGPEMTMIFSRQAVDAK